MVRATAETMPLVTVWPTPKGLPIARTRSPTSSSSESRSSSAGRRSPPTSMRRMARSVRSSVRRICASNSRRSASTTVISSAPRMTWWLVTISPAASTITPEPSEFCTRSAPPGTPPGNWSPKKRRKKGSLSSGEGTVRTVRRVKMLTTAGAVRFTSGAKESWISAGSRGITRGWEATGSAGRTSIRQASAREGRTCSMRIR